MELRFATIVALVLFLTPPVGVFAAVSEFASPAIRPRLHSPEAAVTAFHAAVQRGELSVFGIRLQESMLIARRVAYVYELDGSAPKVTVYSELARPIPIPGEAGCEVRGVSAILDGLGHIVETEAHVWAGD